MLNKSNSSPTQPVLTKKDANTIPVKKGTLVRLAKKTAQTIRIDVTLDEETAIWMDIQYGKVSDTEVAALYREAEKSSYNPNHLLLARVVKKWSFVGSLQEINEAFCEYYIFDQMEKYAKEKEKYDTDIYNWEIDEASVDDDDENAKSQLLARKPIAPTEIDEEGLKQYFRRNLAISENSLELAENASDDDEEPLYHIPPRVETIASMFPTMGENNFVNIIWKQITAKLNPTTLSGEKK